MRLAALLVAGALLLGGCQSSDDDPKPTATATSAAPSTMPAPTDAEIAAADSDVKAAIKAGDTSALRSALREAGTLAGRQAAAEDDQQAVRVDADAHRNYRVAMWWSAEYSDDADLARLYRNGRLLPYAEVARDSALLATLQTLAFRVENDWDDKTSNKLSFHDTYDAAFDKELPDQ